MSGGINSNDSDGNDDNDVDRRELFLYIYFYRMLYDLFNFNVKRFSLE